MDKGTKEETTVTQICGFRRISHSTSADIPLSKRTTTLPPTPHPYTRKSMHGSQRTVHTYKYARSHRNYTITSLPYTENTSGGSVGLEADFRTKKVS